MDTLIAGYRNAAFGLTGLGEFTRQGFERHQRQFAPIAAVAADTVVLVTGANAGLGLAAATALGRLGATVHLLCRSRERGAAAAAAVGARAVLHVVDLSSVRDVKRFVGAWGDAPVSVLINNAGILPAEHVETGEGLEAAFATNTMGTFALTTLLMPVLRGKSQGGARVVVVSSGGALTAKLDVSDVNSLRFKKPAAGFDGSAVYAQTKRQQIELTEYWAAKHPEIQFLSMHPGWADTPGVQSSIPQFHNAMKDRLRTSEQGADTIVWAALSEEAKKVRNGAFLFDRKEVSQHLLWAGTEAAPSDVEKLVEICSKYLRDIA